MRSIHPVLAWLSVLGLAWPAAAHKVQRSGDVAGTWHLEPNHNPRSGEPARVWVALTQAGGHAIPLDQCDCQLVVYDLNQPEVGAVLTPTLQALSPEVFRGIPGTDLTFPKVGEYRLVLTGKPKVPGQFTPFQLSYTTVVGAGSKAGTIAPPPATAQASPTPPSPIPWTMAGFAALALIALGVGQGWQRVRGRQSRQAPRSEPPHSKDRGDRPG
jgi:hypothetical protein